MKLLKLQVKIGLGIILFAISMEYKQKGNRGFLYAKREELSLVNGRGWRYNEENVMDARPAFEMMAKQLADEAFA